MYTEFQFISCLNIIDARFNSRMSDLTSTSDGKIRAVQISGLALAFASWRFYKAKQTTWFKLSYFLTWPVLGSGIIYELQREQNKRIEQLVKSQEHKEDAS